MNYIVIEGSKLQNSKQKFGFLPAEFRWSLEEELGDAVMVERGTADLVGGNSKFTRNPLGAGDRVAVGISGDYGEHVSAVE